MSHMLVFTDGVTDETTRWIPDASPVDRWEEFDCIAVEDNAGLQMVADWVNAVEALARDGEEEADAWALAGRGVLLVTEDDEWAEVVLHRCTVDAGLTPVVVDADDIERLHPGALEELAPAVCLLRPGRWMAAEAPSDESPEERDAATGLRERVAALFAGFDAERPVVFVTIVETMGALHESLRTAQQFDRFFHVPPRDAAAWGAWLMSRLGEARCGDSIRGALALAGSVFSRTFETPRRRALALLALARRAAARQQPLEFVDLSDLCARGFVEGALPLTDDERHRVAVHEAGHAVMVMVEAGFREVPEYSSIIPSLYWQGVVINAAERFEHQPTIANYRVLRRVVREFLAGRAAEELVFGAEEAGYGAHSDLLTATTVARRAFACQGGAPDVDAPGRSGSNLAVLDDDAGQWSALDHERIDSMVREFLRLEYDETMRILGEHRLLLERLADRLVEDNVVAREGFLEEAGRAGYAVRARVRAYRAL
jgi:hypothetical protein